jgi:predicted flap endonuclease-1-like 5' DNA nuclease
MVMMSLALVLLGAAIAFILAWIFEAGSSLNLVYGLLLAIAGSIVGFVIEWLIDERVRQTRALERQLEAQQAASPPGEATPLDDRTDQSHDSAGTLAEVLSQLKALREAQATPPKNGNGSVGETADLLGDLLRQYKDELHQLNRQVAVQDGEMKLLRLSFETYQQSHPDELTRIRGIGPVFQRKLRNMGISSFKQLAQTDPAQIREMLEIKKWQRVDIEGWVEQAAELAHRF